MNRPLPLILLLAAALAAGCASRPKSTHDPKVHFEEDFKKADTDHDEQLSREEVAQGMPSFSEHFEEIDLDKNGELNFAEIWSYVQWRNVANAPPGKGRRGP